MPAIVYSANTAITFDISSLVSSGTLLSGRESTEVNNSSTLYFDAIVNVREILGHASTAPAIGQAISLYAWGADTSLTTAPIDVLDGLDSAETLSHTGVLNSGLVHVRSLVVTVATAGLKYPFPPFSIATLFGQMPKFWGLYLAHDHAGALAASQASKFSFNGITTS